MTFPHFNFTLTSFYAYLSIFYLTVPDAEPGEQKDEGHKYHPHANRANCANGAVQMSTLKKNRCWSH